MTPNPLQQWLKILDITIRQDGEGRCCLNDLHRAAGYEPRHKPSHWLKLSHTRELVKELTDAGNPASVKNQPVRRYTGGKGLRGTFVCEELVYAYALGISPAFKVKVIRAFDAMATRQGRLDPMLILNDAATLRNLLLSYHAMEISAEQSNFLPH